MEKAREFQKNIYCCIDYAKAFNYVDQSKLRKILQEMWVLDNRPCLLRKLDMGQEPTEQDMEQLTGSKFKTVWQDCLLSPCLFIYAAYIMRNVGLDES